MADWAWLQMQQARTAMGVGQLEEALRYLEGPLHQGYRRAYRLARDLSRAFAVRAQRALWGGQRESAWRDLLSAEQLYPSNFLLGELRRELTHRELRRVRALIGRRQASQALELLDRLRNWNVPEEILEPLVDIASAWAQAIEQADRGDFPQARRCLERLRVPEWLQQEYALLVQELQHRQAAFDAALPQLLQALEQENYSQVILSAREVLAAAPNYVLAVRAYQQGCQVMASQVVHPGGILPTQSYQGAAAIPSRRDKAVTATKPPVISSPGTSAVPSQSSTLSSTLPPRLLLWIDNIGSYLLCLSNTVSIGNHGLDRTSLVPICANLHRFHGEICWDSESFWIVSSKADVFVNGRRVQQRELLRHEDRIQLGETCELQFLQPDPQLQTALLYITSGHRLPLSLNGIILMGQLLVFGCHPKAHIPLEPLSNGQLRTSQLSLSRCPEGLGVRVQEPDTFVVQHLDQEQTYQGWSPIPIGATVRWCNFSFTLESDHLLRQDHNFSF
ncbi:MAG: FHA domain-containing protein [Thermogemmata sp.]|nr:FHA domain-containing protein [Thermogemmata sp.]